MYVSFPEVSDVSHLGIFQHPPEGNLIGAPRSIPEEIPELRLIQVKRRTHYRHARFQAYPVGGCINYKTATP